MPVLAVTPQEPSQLLVHPLHLPVGQRPIPESEAVHDQASAGTYGTGVDIAIDVLRQGGQPVLLRDGLGSTRNTWMSSDSGVCLGQKAIPYPCGNVDVLRRTVSGCGLTLQNKANVHIYVPDQKSYDSGGWNYVYSGQDLLPNRREGTGHHPCFSTFV